MSERYVIEINISQLKEVDNPINELDILFSLKHLNYNEINIVRDTQITIAFKQKYDFDLCIQLLREWGINEKNIHQKHTHRIECPPPIPPSNIKYKYFAKDSRIFEQLNSAMKQNPQFLVQTLHLMNKFNLSPPESIGKVAVGVVTSVKDVCSTSGSKHQQSNSASTFLDSLLSSEDEEESEIENEMMKNKDNNPVAIPFKRKANLPKIGVDVKRNKMFE